MVKTKMKTTSCRIVTIQNAKRSNRHSPVGALASTILLVAYSQTRRKRLLKKFANEMKKESRKTSRKLTKPEKSKGLSSTYSRARRFTSDFV